ncbi:cytochrome c peroxidase [Aureispira anguillae]|uniref:Cytochrome c domain-containing protein n=1 Tax=Aureispira anguillae TaxID=2864201 RepID=A0A916DSC6_9BACT|nr:cytochrome c peroxidase [Aureispira anguillae]BDS10721.1 hypothetical protein AsAng_0014300 [Aureispira anguillae]
MKKLFPIFVLALLFVLVSMTNQPSSSPLPSPASVQVKSALIKQLQQLRTTLTALSNALQKKDITTAKTIYLKSRTYFKQAEFLIAYLAPQLYEKNINESPLLKPEPKVASKETHYPKGFQRIDELLFEKDVDTKYLCHLVKNLDINIETFYENIQTLRFYDSIIIHAIKEQLIRSFTLGITGFDTPSSDHAMEDFKQVNKGIVQTLKLYKDHFSAEWLGEIFKHFDQIDYLSFETFDRYDYLVKQLIPILECLEQIRVTAHLETKEELNRLPLPINSSFRNPFQKDFFNPSYFTHIPAKEVTTERILLGKRLFNDPLLSNNLATSCATCHKEAQAFTDQLPHSMNGDKSQTTSRNSPSLNYTIYASAYFHDLRAHDLNNQFDHVIHNEKEFNSSYPAIIKKLATQEEYNALFKKNYAQYPNAISTASINHALKCYLMSLPSFDSQFDQFVQTKTIEIPTEIRLGFNLFMGKAQCATCHFPPTFSGLVPPAYVDSESEVLGVLINENYEQPILDEDLGRMASGIVKDNYDFFAHSFKTVTIRNAKLSAPYMHNGSIKTLDKVIEFYDLGGGLGMGLDLPNQTLPENALNLTKTEKKALVAFIESLTDKHYQ